MQSTKHVALRAGMIVLDERRVNADLSHFPFIEAFEKEASIVAKDSRFQNEYVRNPSDLNFH
jgi:hypothetical protein